jgi:hypothetical protein
MTSNILPSFWTFLVVLAFEEEATLSGEVFLEGGCCSFYLGTIEDKLKCENTLPSF